MPVRKRGMADMADRTVAGRTVCARHRAIAPPSAAAMGSRGGQHAAPHCDNDALGEPAPGSDITRDTDAAQNNSTVPCCCVESSSPDAASCSKKCRQFRQERKSVVKGKSVRVSVDLGVVRIIQKKKQKK